MLVPLGPVPGTGRSPTEAIQPGERDQIRDSKVSVSRVEVFRLGGVRDSIRKTSTCTWAATRDPTISSQAKTS